MSNASFLDDPGATMGGSATLSWLQDAFVVMNMAVDGGPPSSVSVIGRNESLDAYSVLYYDARGVSRVDDMTFDGAR